MSNDDKAVSRQDGWPAGLAHACEHCGLLGENGRAIQLAASQRTLVLCERCAPRLAMALILEREGDR